MISCTVWISALIRARPSLCLSAMFKGDPSQFFIVVDLALNSTLIALAFSKKSLTLFL